MTAKCNQAKDAPNGIAAIRVDDTLMTGNMQFAKAEERVHSTYDMGQTNTITNGSLMKFGGVQIGRDPNGSLRMLCAPKDETSDEFMGRMFCGNFLRES
jgi:hypothetical protein